MRRLILKSLFIVIVLAIAVQLSGIEAGFCQDEGPTEACPICLVIHQAVQMPDAFAAGAFHLPVSILPTSPEPFTALQISSAFFRPPISL